MQKSLKSSHSARRPGAIPLAREMSGGAFGRSGELTVCPCAYSIFRLRITCTPRKPEVTPEGLVNLIGRHKAEIVGALSPMSNARLDCTRNSLKHDV